MKKLLVFIKKHRLFSVIVSPVILSAVMLIVGWPMLIIAGGSWPVILKNVYIPVFYFLVLLLCFVYPLILTVCNVYFIVKQQLSPFEKRISGLTETATIIAGVLLSWFYITELTEIVFADWPKVLYNAQVHTPIAT